MHTIQIDFEVFKALTARRETEAMSHNDVIRELLNLKANNDQRIESGTWVTKGVAFPIGSQFRTKYKGEHHQGEVQKGGLFIKGQLATSPSDAAKIVTGNNVNGWHFWECKYPGHDKWHKIDALRSA